MAAAERAAHQYAITATHVLDRIANGLHRAQALVANGEPGLADGPRRGVPQVQVRAADGGTLDLDQHVRGIAQPGIRYLLDAHVLVAVVHDCLHRLLPLS